MKKSQRLNPILLIPLVLWMLLIPSCSQEARESAFQLPGLSWGTAFSDTAGAEDFTPVTEGVSGPGWYSQGERELWGLSGELRLNYAAFEDGGETYLRQAVFFPQEQDAQKVQTALTEALGTEGQTLKEGGLLWQSPETAASLADEALREQVRERIEALWQNTPFHGTDSEMEKPLVTVSYDGQALYLDGERAALVNLAKEP